MVLIGNKRAILKTITNAFDEAATGPIPYEADRKDEFIESNCGRFLAACLRILIAPDDYVAHRVLLGTRNGVGVGTCRTIADKVLANNLNFRALFYDPLPNEVFTPRETRAIQAARDTLAVTANWQIELTLANVSETFMQLIEDNFDENAVEAWQTFIEDLPTEMNLGELREYLAGSSFEYRESLLTRIGERLGIDADAELGRTSRVRIMSFHSSKGLSAKIVFIPGMEETIFPTRGMQLAAGRVFEAGRLLYVAITRAKAACVVSRSLRRTMNGASTQMAASRFCPALNQPFSREQAESMSEGEIQDILGSIANL